MPSDWYDSVLKRGYVKILDASEINICEHNMELDLRIAAAQSYEDFKKRYKRVYNAVAAARSRAIRVATANVEVAEPHTDQTGLNRTRFFKKSVDRGLRFQV